MLKHFHPGKRRDIVVFYCYHLTSQWHSNSKGSSPYAKTRYVLQEKEMASLPSV